MKGAGIKPKGQVAPTRRPRKELALKLSFLRTYIVENLEKWRKDYSPNIVGVHVGRKEVDGRKTSRLSIVFHVAHKHNADADTRIPRSFAITIPGLEREVRVPTDVIETGVFRHATLRAGDTVQDVATFEVGTSGFLATRVEQGNGEQRLYVCTNAHVIAQSLLHHGHIRIPDQEQRVTTWVFGGITVQALLEEMWYGPVDAALARIPSTVPYTTTAHGLGPIYTPTGIPDDTFMNRPVWAWGAASQRVLRGVISDIDVVLPAPNGTPLTGVIQFDLNRNCIRGDSGGPVVQGDLRLVAILIGHDNRYSYGVPVARILSLFNATAITN